MNFSRSSGVLLHPTSFTGTPGIGTIGKPAYRFADWLAEAGQTLWQILPIGPTGYGDSPYASFSTFAGNPLMIDLDTLVEWELATPQDITTPPYIRSEGKVDFGSVVYWKTPLLQRIAANFQQKKSHPLKKEYEQFSAENSDWLENYALFMDVKACYDAKAKDEGVHGAMWSNYWPEDLALHKADAIEEWRKSHADGIERHKIIQFFFFRQWRALKKYVNEKGISIIGDIPVFVAPDSADVWANQDLFQLSADGKPTFVAGVPPDYFSETGQLWGNPLYNWDAMAKDGYAWWIKRIQATLAVVDFIRIDHFRGFEAYWAIPAGEKTAINGRWIKGPDHALFVAIKNALGDLPILAEDLGLITDEVRALRDDFRLPGMKVLQFAFDAAEAGKSGFTNAFLPHMYDRNCIVYTGTHDNDTMRGWLDHASEEELELVRSYLRCENADLGRLVNELIHSAMASVAEFAIFPMQDLLGLGSEARMNTPSTLGDNWDWRMDAGALKPELAAWLKKESVLYARNYTRKK